jgi:hypothetical protein
MPLLELGATIALGLRYFTIIYLTGLGGLFCERSGIVNIGLEGILIVGTVMGAWGSVEFGPIPGLLIGAGAGLLFSLVHALATVTFRVDLPPFNDKRVRQAASMLINRKQIVELRHAPRCGRRKQRAPAGT